MELTAERFQCIFIQLRQTDKIKCSYWRMLRLLLCKSILDVTTILINVLILNANNNDALWVDGFKVDTDTNGGVSQGVDRLNFDNGTGTSDFYGNTKEIGYYDTALTDEELEYLTSYRSLNELVTELNLNTL